MIALTRSRQLILVSAFALPMMVAVGAVGHLVSLDASIPQPLLVPSLEGDRTEPMRSIVPNFPEKAEVEPTQTDRERQNATQAQLQEGDWLMKRGQFKAAKTIYQALLDRSDSDAEVKTLATRRLEKLDKAIVAANLRDKQTQDKLKAEAKKKSLLKPEVKSATQPKPIAKPVALVTTPNTPVLVSAPEQLDAFPGELAPGSNLQPSSARELTGTYKIDDSVRFERSVDLTTELGEPLFEPEAVPVTPRRLPNFVGE